MDKSENGGIPTPERLLIQCVVSHQEHEYWADRIDELTQLLIVAAGMEHRGDSRSNTDHISASLREAFTSREVWASTADRALEEMQAYAVSRIKELCPEWQPGNTRDILDMFERGES